MVNSSKLLVVYFSLFDCYGAKLVINLGMAKFFVFFTLKLGALGVCKED